jgi:hypothetical protein
VLVRLLVIIFCFCVAPAFGQTRSDIRLKHGTPTFAYSVSEHISMTPDYAADGQVCRMRLYPKHIGPNINYLSPQLDFEELSGVLNNLVPLGFRGLKDRSSGMTDIGGGIGSTTYRYENVTFVFTFPFRINLPVKDEGELFILSIGEDFPISEDLRQLPKKVPPSVDDFAQSKGSKTEIVTIVWNDRKCTDQ